MGGYICMYLIKDLYPEYLKSFQNFHKELKPSFYNNLEEWDVKGGGREV